MEEDETLLKVLEVDAEVTEYLRSTYKVDWDPEKTIWAEATSGHQRGGEICKAGRIVLISPGAPFHLSAENSRVHICDDSE